MQITINPVTLGQGQLYDRIREKHCALGKVCKAAGIEDANMDFRSHLLIKELPAELVPFFRETSWEPINDVYVNKMKDGCKRFVLTALGQCVTNINDAGLKGAKNNWQDELVEIYAQNNIEITWGEELEEVEDINDVTTVDAG